VSRVLAVIVVALAVVAPATAKAKPKPWMWTSQVAAVKVGALELAPLNDVSGTTTVKRCAGKGKHVGKTYASFACSVTFTPRGPSSQPQALTLWVKVRKVGRGEPCVWTTAAVPAACTNPRGARMNGDDSDAAGAVATKLGNFQGPLGCAAWGVGYFRCWFGANAADDPANGWATVVLLKTGPVVTVTKQFVKPS
jgi:hypothetical protein